MLLETLHSTNNFNSKESNNIPCKFTLNGSCHKRPFCRYTHSCKCKQIHTCNQSLMDGKQNKRTMNERRYSAGDSRRQQIKQRISREKNENTGFQTGQWGISRKSTFLKSEVYKITTVLQYFNRTPLCNIDNTLIAASINLENLKSCM